MAFKAIDTIDCAIKKQCLALPKGARRCKGKTQKNPFLQGFIVDFVPVGASLCQTRNHSHSIVPGGLLVMSYVTRLMPRTSLT
ncbi:MAG: hypothetical protein POH28_04510, partial [Acidocella sp.]|nr:hypothetical protein [Acidocella sp.]